MSYGARSGGKEEDGDIMCYRTIKHCNYRGLGDRRESSIHHKHPFAIRAAGADIIMELPRLWLEHQMEDLMEKKKTLQISVYAITWKHKKEM